MGFLSLSSSWPHPQDLQHLVVVARKVELGLGVGQQTATSPCTETVSDTSLCNMCQQKMPGGTTGTVLHSIVAEVNLRL